jgi:isoamylase
MVLNGSGLDEYNDRGERVADDTLLIMLNSDSEPVRFAIPDIGETWEVVLDTCSPKLGRADHRPVKSGAKYELQEHSVVVMRRTSP